MIQLQAQWTKPLASRVRDNYDIHPRHVGTGAASALPTGTLRAPPLGLGGAFPPLPPLLPDPDPVRLLIVCVLLLVGFAPVVAAARAGFFASCAAPTTFAPPTSFARFTPPSPRAGADWASARAFPLSFARDGCVRRSGGSADGCALRFVP